MTKSLLTNKPKLPASIRNSLWFIGMSGGVSFATGTGHLAGIFALAKHKDTQQTIEIGVIALEGLILLNTIVTLVLALLIRSGREWPRYVYATFMSITVIPITICFVSGFPLQPLFYISISVVGAVLLFVPSSNRYYEARQHDRYS